MRTKSQSMLAAAALALAAGCSHEKAQTQAVPETPPAPPAATRAETSPAPEPTQVRTTIKDDGIFFAFDSALLPEDSRPFLQQLAEKVKANPRAKIRIEGNCDERGTQEYNLGLGAHRAEAAKKYLETLGIPASRIETVSYGSERPKYQGHDEDSWSKNRRDDVVVK
jgi:peptidoglycan-associated lipoprotein